MRAKKAILISSIIFVLIIAAVTVVMCISHDNTYDNSHEIKTIYCTEDYPELYKEELRIIFGENYRIGEKETITQEGEDCGCGFYMDTYIYDRWKVTYEDRLGQEYTQTLNNIDTLEDQQIKWLKEQLMQHYKKQFMIEYFEEGTLQELSVEENGRTHCFVFLGNPAKSSTSAEKEAYERAKEAGRIYWKQLLESLGNKENMIHLWELDYQQIFRDFPMYVSISLCIDDEELTGDEKAELVESVREKTLQMMEAINEESGYTCNLDVDLFCSWSEENLYDGKWKWQWYFLQGEPIETDIDFKGYTYELFDSYEGVFW